MSCFRTVEIYCSEYGPFLFILEFKKNHCNNFSSTFFCFHMSLLIALYLFFRCFGLLLSPGKNVKNSDMHLLDLVGVLSICLFIMSVMLSCKLELCSFSTGINGKEFRREVLHHHRKLEPQHASVSSRE